MLNTIFEHFQIISFISLLITLEGLGSESLVSSIQIYILFDDYIIPITSTNQVI